MDLMTTDQVAEYVGLSRHTLNTWRSTGKGPHYIKVGGLVRYSRSQVDYWLGVSAVKPPRQAHGNGSVKSNV